MISLRAVAAWLAISGVASWYLTALMDPSNRMFVSKAELCLAAVLALVDWWRRGGRKVAERVWARVVNLGHRLTTAPVLEGAS